MCEEGAFHEKDEEGWMDGQNGRSFTERGAIPLTPLNTSVDVVRQTVSPSIFGQFRSLIVPEDADALPYFPRTRAHVLVALLLLLPPHSLPD